MAGGDKHSRLMPTPPRRSLASVNSLRAATRRAVSAAFLLFAAALFVVGPAEASRTTTETRSSLASISAATLAPSPSLALVDSVRSSPRFGFGEDLGLLDPEAGPDSFAADGV